MSNLELSTAGAWVLIGVGIMATLAHEGRLYYLRRKLRRRHHKLRG